MMPLDTFHRALNAWGVTGIQYGSRDCAQFAQFMIKELGGPQIIDFEYHGESEATAIINAKGGLRGVVTSLIGEPVDELSELRRGDPVMFNAKGIEGLGIVESKDFFVALAETKRGARVAIFPMDYVVCGWHVMRGV